MSNNNVEERLGAVETFVRSMAADVNQAGSRLWHVFEKQAGHSVELADLKAIQTIHSRDLTGIADKLDGHAKEFAEFKAAQEIHTRDISQIRVDITAMRTSTTEVKALQAAHSSDIAEVKALQVTHSSDIAEVKALQATQSNDIADIKDQLQVIKRESDVRHVSLKDMLQECLDRLPPLAR